MSDKNMCHEIAKLSPSSEFERWQNCFLNLLGCLVFKFLSSSWFDFVFFSIFYYINRLAGGAEKGRDNSRVLIGVDCTIGNLLASKCLASIAKVIISSPSSIRLRENKSIKHRAWWQRNRPINHGARPSHRFVSESLLNLNDSGNPTSRLTTATFDAFYRRITDR